MATAAGGNHETLLGIQTVKGTAATQYLRVLTKSNNINGQAATKKSEALTGSREESGGFVSSIKSGGSISVELTRDTLTKILETAGFTKTAVGDIATYKVSPSIDVWMTVLKVQRDIGMFEKFLDCRIDKLSIKAVKESYITADIEILAISDEQVDGTPETAGFTIANTADEALICLDTVVKMEAADMTAEVEDISIEIGNAIDGDHIPINSLYRKSLEATAFTCNISMTAEAEKTKFIAYKNKIKTNAYTDMEVTFTDKVKFVLPRFKVEEAEMSPSGKGRLTVPIKGSAYKDITENTSLKIVIDNS